MKKAPAPATTQRAFENHEAHLDFTPPTRFVGTDNPRHLRAIAALLRRRGLEAPCQRIRFIDRDGSICRPGVYSLTSADRRKIHAWMATRGKQGAAHG